MRAHILFLLVAVAWCLAGGTAVLGQVDLDIVPVGNTGNPPDVTGFGKVNYDYFIGKYEVTNAEYAAFLNTVATLGDPYSLYHPSMSRDPRGGVVRHGDGTDISPYRYQVKGGMHDKPVNFVSFYDAVRFINWMSNGYLTGGTEWGTYTITDGGPDSGILSQRRAVTPWVLPSEDEWYKAAYYDPRKDDKGGYWNFAMEEALLAEMADEPARTQGPSGSLANVLTAGADAVAAGLNALGSVFSGLVSAYGTHGQIGNLREWTESRDGEGVVLRGRLAGSLEQAKTIGREIIAPDQADAETGFRVARISVISGEPISRLSETSLETNLMADMYVSLGGGYVGGYYTNTGSFSSGGRGGARDRYSRPQGVPEITTPPAVMDTDVPSSPITKTPDDPGRPTPPVPEPATALLTLMGGLALAGRRR